jgi:hypothetical protein
MTRVNQYRRLTKVAKEIPLVILSNSMNNLIMPNVWKRSARPFTPSSPQKRLAPTSHW